MPRQGMHSLILSTVLNVANGLGTWVYPTSRGCGFFANVTGVELIVEVTLPQERSAACAVRSLHVLPLDLGLLCYGQGPSPRFREAFSVRADEPGRAEGLLRKDVQSALLTLWRMTLPVHRLSLDDYALEVGATPDHSGLASPEYLLLLLRHCAWVGRLLRHAAQDVPPPGGLADVVRSFRAQARELGLQLGTAPLVLAGKRRRIACRARVKRVAPLSYSLVVEGAAPQRLGADLTLRPRTPFLDRLASDRVPMDFGDPAFESSFEVFAKHAPMARQVFTAELRQRFIALARFGVVSAMDSEVRVESPKLLHDTGWALSALSEVVELLACMHRIPAGREHKLRAYR